MTTSIKKTTRGKIEIAIEGALDYISATVVGMIQQRSARGISSDGTPFKPYSNLYSMQLLAVGESEKVDLTRSGGYLGSISERRRVVNAQGGTIYIGPGTGTSRGMPLPPPYVFSESKTPEQRAEAFSDWQASPKKATRSPPHNVLGAIHEKGNGRIPPRPHLGLTPQERKALAEKIMKFAIKQGR